ncbi:hypothetical protein OBBRIDRAFT_143896 [Obba rivulosa]|uniref:Small RNA 2'-O-methyltransferase n=1 Tax=Obba rivulosa TaxID=1052685 RepID=A0A8E2DRN7_9APHY|nr:hypothetical protein OBBRIDRAFT_143896 [Obba rivulosa]
MGLSDGMQGLSSQGASLTQAEADTSAQTELPVTFFPPLSQQRRAWVFDVLRRESVTTVLDIGCGEGDLIGCLCNPAPWLPPSHTVEIQALLEAQKDSFQHDASRENAITSYPYDGVHMQPIRVIGLDISAAELGFAIEQTVPADPKLDSWRSHMTRWIPLDVEIWEGGLESVNPGFMDIDCIISTEVIEHLPEEVLQDFPPIVLGVYQPRLLLLTTPSYTFNARFTAPDAAPSVRRAYPDPTGRTDRIFRHADHKFEWTVEEFTQWCETIADDWGYEVEVAGVGKPNEKDPWNRDESLGWASQVAMFRRKEGGSHRTERRARCERNGILERASQRKQHQLLASYRHTPHESAQRPVSLQSIGDLARDRLLEFHESSLPVRELWTAGQLDVPCGGSLELLVLAAAEHDALEVRCKPAEPIAKWQILLKNKLPEKEEDTCKPDHVSLVGDIVHSSSVDATALTFLAGQENSSGGWGDESSPWEASTSDDWHTASVHKGWGWGETFTWETDALANEPVPLTSV